MAANSNIVGKLYRILTTGFVTSLGVAIRGIQVVPGTAAWSSSVVDRVNQKVLVRGRGSAGVGLIYVGPIDLMVTGLSCTVLGGSAEVIVYCR